MISANRLSLKSKNESNQGRFKKLVLKDLINPKKRSKYKE